MTRDELWNTGRDVDFSEHLSCGGERCRSHTIREFDFGFFCEKCFHKAPECSEDGCANPVHSDRLYDNGGRCRSCEFDYDGELEIYMENNLSQGDIWSTGNSGCVELNRALDRALLKHKINRHQRQKPWHPAVEKRGFKHE